MKKLFALLLSCALMLGATTTALAADEEATPDENGVYKIETEIESSVKAPTIKVTVPTTGAVGINPYGMEFEVDGLDEAATDKIISPVQFIKNESDVAISVDVSVSATPAEGVTLATAALKGTETTKSVFLYFEIANAEDASTEPTWADAYNAKTAGHVIVGTEAKPTVKTGVVQLAAGDDAATYAAFHMAGDVASKSAKPWADTDTVDVKIAFTFNPVYTDSSSNG